MTRIALAVSTLLATTLSLGVAHGQGVDSLPGGPNLDSPNQRTSRLARETREALAIENFDARNRAGAEAVAREASWLVNHELGIRDPERQAEIQRIFRAGAVEAGAAFAPAFDRNGVPNREQKEVYTAAKSVAGGIAYRAMGPSIEQALPETASTPRAATRLADEAVSKTRIEDVAKFVAKSLGMPEPPLKSGAELVRTIDRVVPENDYFRDEVPRIQTRAPGERPLNRNQFAAMKLGVFGANGSWKGGQIHQAAWEVGLPDGSLKRIRPGQGSSFDALDRLMTSVYEHTRAEYMVKANDARGGNRTTAQYLADADEGRRRGFAAAVFLIWKDVLQLKKAQAEAVRTPESLERHNRQLEAFEQRLAQERAEELKRLSLPELLVKARARGLEVKVTTPAAELVTALSGLKPAQASTLEASAPRGGATAGFSDLLERVGQRGGAKGGRRGR